MFEVNTGNRKKYQIIAADCETDPFPDLRTNFTDIPVDDINKVYEIKPFVWGMYDGKNYTRYDCWTDMVEEISNKYTRPIVYFHNGGKFDLLFFIRELLELNSELSFIGSNLAVFKYKNIEFRDSLRVLPVPLDKLNKMDFDYSLLEKEKRDIPENRLLIEQYLESDCVNLHDALRKFITQYGLHATIASAAFKTWLGLEKSKNPYFKTPKTDYNFFTKFKPFYFGGRTQTFVKGYFKKRCTMLDINSAYPTVMSKLNHAYGSTYKVSKTIPKSKTAILKSFFEVDATPQGCFPLREKTRLSFPRNKRAIYKVTGHELLAGIETKTVDIHNVINVYTFTQTINFKSYIDKFYKLKKKYKKLGDNVNEQIAKLFLNSLYGKFCTDSLKFYDHKICHSGDIRDLLDDGNKILTEYYKEELGIDEDDPRYRLIVADLVVGTDLTILKTPSAKNDEFINMATGASITGAVRAMMWRQICSVGYDKVMYADTDSLLIFGRDIKAFSVGDELGQWDIEMKPEEVAIGGKKLYALKEGDKIKVRSKGAKLNYHEILEVASGGVVEFRQEAPQLNFKSKFSDAQFQKFIKRDIKNTAFIE